MSHNVWFLYTVFSVSKQSGVEGKKAACPQGRRVSCVCTATFGSFLNELSWRLNFFAMFINKGWFKQKKTNTLSSFLHSSKCQEWTSSLYFTIFKSRFMLIFNNAVRHPFAFGPHWLLKNALQPNCILSSTDNQSHNDHKSGAKMMKTACTSKMRCVDRKAGWCW